MLATEKIYSSSLSPSSPSSFSPPRCVPISSPLSFCLFQHFLCLQHITVHRCVWSWKRRVKSFPIQKTRVNYACLRSFMSTYFGWSLAAEQCWVCRLYKTELDIFFIKCKIMPFWYNMQSFVFCCYLLYTCKKEECTFRMRMQHWRQTAAAFYQTAVLLHFHGVEGRTAACRGLTKI